MWGVLYVDGNVRASLSLTIHKFPDLGESCTHFLFLEKQTPAAQLPPAPPSGSQFSFQRKILSHQLKKLKFAIKTDAPKKSLSYVMSYVMHIITSFNISLPSCHVM